MKALKTFALILSLVIFLCSCSTADKGTTDTTTPTGIVAPVEAEFATTDDEMFTKNDINEAYNSEKSVSIILNGDAASCTSSAVGISDGIVTIKDEGTFIISGSLTNGMIVVDASESAKPHLIFSGVDITSNDCAPLYILNAEKVFVTLADGTKNALTNGGSFTSIDENNIDGTVFSKQDLTFNGSGSLTVTSPSGHGIVCKDDLVFTNGTFTINSASHGIDANDSVRITKASISIDSGKDGIHTENADDTTKGFFYASSGSITIEAEGDGISSGAYSQISGGTFNILAGGGSENGEAHSSDNFGGFMGGGMGGRPGGGPGGHGGMKPTSLKTTTADTTDESTSMKGVKSAGGILISSGKLTVDSADDGIHSDTSVIVNGGTFEIASGDDGIHAEETLSITNGTINISESYEGLEALNIAISGGDIKSVSNDDGLNAAGGADASGFGGRDNGNFGSPGGMSSSNGTIIVSGGKLYINASGDGIDSNGSLEISGGYTVVTGPTRGDTATLDYDTTAIISGGTFIGTGASGMAQTFSESQNQGIISVNVGNQSPGTEITITDSSGKTIISHSPELEFSVAIISSSDITKGETYTVTVGSSTGDFEAA